LLAFDRVFKVKFGERNSILMSQIPLGRQSAQVLESPTHGASTVRTWSHLKSLTCTDSVNLMKFNSFLLSLKVTSSGCEEWLRAKLLHIFSLSLYLKRIIKRARFHSPVLTDLLATVD